MNEENIQFFHDITRKKLFANREITRSFIAGITELENIEKNITDIIPIPTQHFDSTCKKTENDCIWKICLNNNEVVYLYLMLEFQSSIDKKMSYRILNYVINLANKIIAEDNIKEGNYPDIIPIVLYNGDIKWNAAINTRDLYKNKNPFPKTTPTMEYVLIEEKIYNSYNDEQRPKKALLADNIFKFINIDNFENLQPILLQLREFLVKKENAMVCQNLQDIFIKTLQHLKAPQDSYDLVYKTFTGENKMTAGQIERLKDNLQKSVDKVRKESFFDGLFLALSIKFDEITEKLKQQFLELKPKNMDLKSYKSVILSSSSAEEAYNKIAKLASA